MSAILEDLLVGMRSHWRRQKTIRQLSTLSDHALKDIGLDRSEIRSIAEDLVTKRDGSRVRIAQSTIPVVAPINSTKSSTDYIVQRDAA